MKNKSENIKGTVVYIGGFELPDKNAAAKRVLSVAKIFKLYGLYVVLIGIDREVSDNIPLLQTKSYVQGFESYSLSYPNNIKDWIKRATSIFQYQEIISNIQNIKAIVCYNLPAISLYLIYKFCKSKQISCISDITEWYHPSGSNYIMHIGKWVDTYLRMNIVNKKVDTMIVISSYLESYYRRKNKKIYIVPPLTDICIENKSNNNKIIIGYAGTPFRLGKKISSHLEVKDRLDLAVMTFAEIAQETKSFIFNIYGLTKEEYLTAYPDHKTILDKANGVIFFHGKKTMQEVQKAINSFDFTILLRDLSRTSLAGFPTKVVESLSCGTPVITSKFGDIAEYIKDGKNGFFVEIDDRQELARQMRRIIGLSKDKLSEMKKITFESYIFLPENFKKFDSF